METKTKVSSKKPWILHFMICSIFLQILLPFVPPSLQALPQEEDNYLQILEWTLEYSVIGSDSDIFQTITATPPPDSSELTETFRYESAEENETTYASVGRSKIIIDNCSANSSVGRYEPPNLGRSVAVTIIGGAVHSCLGSEDEGGLRITLFIADFFEVLKTRSVGPFRVKVLDTENNLSIVGNQVDPRGVYEQGEYAQGTVVDPFVFTLPEGTYSVEVYENEETWRGEANGIEVQAGFQTEKTIILNREGTELNEIEASERAIRAPCSGLGVGWLICHAVNGIYIGIRFLYESIVVPMLAVQPIQTTDENGDRTDLYQIWSNLRVIANVMFIFIFLAAILGVGTSWFFTQYELKKMIPRLFIGIVLTQISWFIIAFIIDSGNFLGAGIRGLILSPAQDIPNASFDLNVFGGFIGNLLSFGGLALVFKSSITARGVLYALPLILVPIIVALVIVIFVLAARQFILILLAVFSPIVFILWSLPGTGGVLGQWWETFWRLILMYPLIIALIAGGELASRLLVVGREDNPWFYIVGLAALFAPFFLIPATFKFAGNAITNIASGFDNTKKSVNERLFGSGDPYGRGGYIARVKDFNETVAQQKMFKNMRSSARFTGDMRTQAGLKPGGTSWRDFMSKSTRPSAKALAKYGLFHVASPNGDKMLGFQLNLGRSASRAAMSANARMRPVTVDRRMAQRTQKAKKFMDSVTSQQQDFVAHAMFGDTNVFTGEALPEWAIIEAKEYRGDSAAQNAFLKYLVTQATTDRKWQQLFNHYAEWNPYAQPAPSDNPHMASNKRGALAGKKSEYDTFEAAKVGNLKGATFGTQGQRKDGKNRDLYGVKTATYIAKRADMVWDRGITQSQVLADWEREIENTPSLRSLRDSIQSTTSETDRQRDRRTLDQRKKDFMNTREAEFKAEFKAKNAVNYGRVRDGSLPEALGEINYDMPYTGKQKGSTFEMMSEASHRVQEIDENFEDLVAFAEKETIIKNTKYSSNPKTDSAMRKEATDEAKAELKAKIGNVESINAGLEPSQTEAVQILRELTSNDQLGYADYANLSPEEKARVRRRKLEQWRDVATEEVKRSRNLVIDTLESAGQNRPDAGDTDPGEQPPDEGVRERTVWRMEELPQDPVLHAGILKVLDPKLAKDIDTYVESLGIHNRNIDERNRVKEEEAVRKLAQLGVDDASPQFGDLMAKLHTLRINEILDRAETGAPLGQIDESVDFARMSDWTEGK